jgi:starch phosphorylase
MKALRVDRFAFLALGREHANHEAEHFSMTVLAIRTSNVSNGVSKLHGVVSRKMWRNIFPGLPDSEVPIKSITNGVHTLSWVAPDIGALFDRYLGQAWTDKPTAFEVWNRVEHIPDAELWRTHERCRERLVALARVRLQKQRERLGATRADILAAEEVLDPEALTIGFARRFATYKRGTLVFRDLERLNAILNHKERPVQLVFSGKAHPKDQGGKELIAQVAQFARRPEFRRRVVFLEDYDMNIARTLVQGVDVWLNNPRRPLEASGTSGMKVCVNGGINLSILDGWWDEAEEFTGGWTIGERETYSEDQDGLHASAIYYLLENEIVPLYFESREQTPREWMKRVKRSLKHLSYQFDARRMVSEYMSELYHPAHVAYTRLRRGEFQEVRDRVRWNAKVREVWDAVHFVETGPGPVGSIISGLPVPVRAALDLAGLKPEDVRVEVVVGRVGTDGSLEDTEVVVLPPTEQNGTIAVFARDIVPERTGRIGYALRVSPDHCEDPLTRPCTNLLKWGSIT